MPVHPIRRGPKPAWELLRQFIIIFLYSRSDGAILTVPMDMRTKTLIGGVLVAGAIGYWLFADDPETLIPESQTTGQAVRAPAQRIPGMPYKDVANDPNVRAWNSVSPRPANRQSTNSRPVQGFRFRPLDNSSGSGERYQPYNRPFSDYTLQPDFGASYGVSQQPSYAPVEKPNYPAYQFRPLEEDQQSRRQQGSFRPMAAPPASLAGPGSNRVWRNPYPT